MLEILILFWIVMFIFLAWGFVWIVRRMTLNHKLYRRLAIAFVVLLTTWDVILGYLVYYPACYFVPKTTIYETAETDGIYYEGDYKNEFWMSSSHVAFAHFDLKRGYRYMESLVTSKSHYVDKTRITPTVYRCVPISRVAKANDYLPIKCEPVEKATSQYMVKVKKIGLGLCEMNFMKIVNRSNGKLMAEYSEVVLNNKANFISFMDWTRVGEGGGDVECCPKKSRLYDFQFDVLKLKRQTN